MPLSPEEQRILGEIETHLRIDRARDVREERERITRERIRRVQAFLRNSQVFLATVLNTAIVSLAVGAAVWVWRRALSR